MITTILLSITLIVGQQSARTHSWVCSDIESEDRDNDSTRKAQLDIVIFKRRVSGKLKIYEEGEIIKVSDLVGVMYLDGSVSLGERWVDGKTLSWMPNYSSIVITDINASEFKLNYNSASYGRAHTDKGQMIFKRLTNIERS